MPAQSTNRSALKLCCALAAAILISGGGSAAHAGLNPYSRFMNVETWSFHWVVTAQASGSDTLDDATRTFTYSAGSSGTVKMTREYFKNIYGQTWRSPEGADTQGEVLYNETVTKSNGKTRTTDVTPAGQGYFEDSFPFSIDAVAGTYSLSIPQVSVESLYKLNDEGYTVSQNMPCSIVPWPLLTANPIPALYWEQRPLPAQGLTIRGSYSFTSQFPQPSIYLPAGVTHQVNYTITPLDINEDLKALPRTTGPIERGQTVELDGTDSTGDIDTYEWSFKTLAPGPPQADTSVKLKGATVTVKLLKSMLVTLTVKDGNKSNKKTIPVVVKPRSWELPFEQVPQEGVLPDSMGGKPFHRSGSDIEYSGGENVCAIDPPANDSDPPHIIHPKKDDGNSWDGSGYELEQVQDEGPFNGWWYVKDKKIEVRRQVLLNKYILPGGPMVFSSMEENFYTANKSRDKNVDGYLAAARAHESDHTTKMRWGKNLYDVAKKLESATARDRDELKGKADGFIQRAEDLMSWFTSDCRMPVTWRGELVVPDEATFIWTPQVFMVGGAPNG